MQKIHVLRKSIVIGIVLSFVGTCISPSTAKDIQQIQKNGAITEEKGDVAQHLQISTYPDPDEVTVTYSFPQPTLEDIMINNTVYTRVLCSETSSYGNPGEPLLPVRGARILTPQGRTVSNIRITTGEKNTLMLENKIEPGATPVPLSQPETACPPEPNGTIYGSSNPFPDVVFHSVGVYNAKGYQILIGRCCPVQYISAENILYYYSSVTVTVTTVPATNVNQLFRGLETDKEQIKRMVDNPEVLSSYATGQSPGRLTQEYDLLILTTNALKQGFQRLAEVHNATGIRTIIKTLGTDIPLGDGTNQTIENIRNYIRDAYNHSHLSYVLIGGDQDVIPARFLYYGDYEGDSYTGPSDLYYACLDGTFNYDNDTRWGEPTDGEHGGDVDLLAEVYVGRACVGNLIEVGYFVGKTLDYMSRGVNDEYLSNYLMVGEFMGSNPFGDFYFGEDYMDQLINGSSASGYTTVGIPNTEYSLYNVSRLYDRDWPGFNPYDPYHNLWPVEEIISRINSGVHVINHMGHAGKYVDMRLNLITNDLDRLTNDEYCFIYSQGCDAGAFDRNASDNPQHPIVDCFAEHITIKNEHGAFAGIWNSRLGWIGPSQYYQRQFWDAVFGENITVMSQANQDSKEDNIYRINETHMRWCCYELNLFGDPALAFPLIHPAHNVGFKTVTIPTPVQSQHPVMINASLRNTGEFIEHNVTVYLLVNTRVMSKTTIPLFGNHTTQQVSFKWMPQKPGVYQILLTVIIPGVNELVTWDNQESQTVTCGVQNIETGECFNTIQQAINDTDTQDGHHLLIPTGLYKEHLIVSKNLSLTGREKSYTVIDAGGYTGPVISIPRRSHVTIANVTITNGYHGVLLASSSDSTIQNTIISGNKRNGIFITGTSRRNTVLENDIDGNAIGFNIETGGTRNLIYHNNFNNSHNAVDTGTRNLWNNTYYVGSYLCGGNYWSDHQGEDQYIGVHQNIPGSDGISDTPYLIFGGNSKDRYPLMEPYRGTLKTTIYVDNSNMYGPWEGTPDHPFQFIQDAVNHAVSGQTIYVYSGIYNEPVEIHKSLWLRGEDRNTTIIDYNNGDGSLIFIGWASANISGFTISHSDDGIYVRYGSARIFNNTIIHHTNGVHLYDSGNISIQGNILTSNNLGVWVDRSTVDVLISGNLITNSFDTGVQLWMSHRANVTQNIIIKGEYGVNSWSSYDNVISHNILANFTQAGMSLQYKRHNVFENTVTNSSYGIKVTHRDNIIVHNNFMRNTHNGYDNYGHNIYNLTYPGGGNYWDNYGGVDLYSGPGQNQSGPDGMGDTPYRLDQYYSARDYYPFMSPYGVLSADAHGPYVGLMNEPIHFNGSAGGGTHIYSWFWEFGDGNTSTEQKPLHVYSEAGNYTAVLTVTDSGGNTSNDTASVMIRPLYVDAHGPYYGYINVPLQFTGSVLGGVPPFTWFWEFGDADHHTSDEQNPRFTYNESYIYTVRLTVTDQLGNRATDTATVTIHADIFWVDDNFNESTPGWGYTHFKTIQDGVTHSADGDTVLVMNGTYIEHVTVNKRLLLIGENKNATIIDGSGTGTVLSLSAQEINVTGFTIRQGATGLSLGSGSSCSTICGNVITGNTVGISLRGNAHWVFDNLITENQNGMQFESYFSSDIIWRNTISHNSQRGIWLKGNCKYNTFYENTITDNGDRGVQIDSSSTSNSFYHNNFINNPCHAYSTASTYWDDSYPSAGNYWDNYTGSDNYSGSGQNDPGSDGLGDTPLHIQGGSNVDHYPLMRPWNGTYPVPMPDPVYVDDNFNESTPGWGIDHFQRIQEGLTAVKRGGIVSVSPGTYFERLHLRKPVTLAGEQKETTILDGHGFGPVVEFDSYDIAVTGFTIQNGGDYGAYFALASHCQLMGNIIRNQTGAGVCFYSTISTNRVTNNLIINNYMGISIWLSDGTAFILGNQIINNYCGVYCQTGGFIYIYHNNFITNTYQGYDEDWFRSYGHYWYNEYPSGGNYWSDYTGVDHFSGPGQNQSGSDGIGDTPYYSQYYFSDRYPLMDPYGPFQADAHGPYEGAMNFPVQFTGSALGGHLPYASWLWEFGDADNHTSTEQNPVFPYTESGTYTVTLTVTDHQGITSSDSTTVAIQQLLAKANGPYYGIVNETMSFTGSVLGGTPEYTWLWDFDDGNTSTEQNPRYTYHHDGLYTVLLTVTDSEGQHDTDTAMVFVHPLADIYVDDDFNASTPGWGTSRFKRIQDGVNHSSDGDLVYVYSGLYHEHVNVGKKIQLIGENRTTTIIDGSGTGVVIYGGSQGHVTIKRFTLQNGGSTTYDAGIELYYGSYNSVLENSITTSNNGILLYGASHNTITNNMIMNIREDGIRVKQADSNTIIGNTVINSSAYGIAIYDSSNDNVVYHNNFIGNHLNAAATSGPNIWDNGYPSGGNYFDNYTGVDDFHGPGQNESGPDGIGDTPYLIPGGNNRDRYPFMMLNGWLYTDDTE
jgi:parallel beta-helix repeat protein